MPSAKNTQTLLQIKEKMQKANAVVLTDYKGLSVAQQTELRNQLKEVEAELKVYKNTLLKLAFRELGYDVQDAEKNLAGPAAAVFAYQDQVAPIKKVAEFSQLNQLPKFKFGFLEKEFIDADRVKQVGNLPSKEILLAKLVGGLNSPISGLTSVLQGNLRKLVYVLNQVQSAKVKN